MDRFFSLGASCLIACGFFAQILGSHVQAAEVSPNPSPSPLLTLTVDHPQATVGQLSTLVVTLSDAYASPSGMETVMTGRFDSKPVLLYPMGNHWWVGSARLSQVGTHTWSANLNARSKAASASDENEIQAYSDHVGDLQNELSQPGLTPAQKTAIQTQISSDEGVIWQLNADLNAMNQIIETDQTTMVANPAPSPSPSPSASHSVELDTE